MTANIRELSSTSASPTLQHDFILLDGSSSMASKWSSSLASIDAYCATAKTLGVNSNVTLATFDNKDVLCIQRNCALANWKPLHDDPIGSWGGMTPLYDAINALGRHLHTIDPPRASVLVVTDGEENASRNTTLDQAKLILDWMRAKGWQVTFIGCDFNNRKQASLLGANPPSAIGVAAGRLSDATASLARKRARYSQTGEQMHYSEDERQQFGGYLANG